MAFQNWSKRTKTIVATVTTVSVLALALGLGLGLGLKKKSAIPEPIDIKFLSSVNCPAYSKLARNGDQVTIDAVLRTMMKIGSNEETKYILEYGPEKITLVVDASTSRWLLANAPSGSVIRVKGIKTDCSIRVAYDPSNDANKPNPNTNINVVTTTTQRPNPTTNGGEKTTETFKPTSTVNPPETTTTIVNPPQTTTTIVNPETTTTIVNPPQTTTEITTTTIVNPPTPTPGVRNLKIAVVLFGFTNAPAPQQSGEEFLNDLMYGNGENGMNTVFGKNFYNKVSFSGLVNSSKSADVFGWVNINYRNDDNCHSFDWAQMARDAFGINEFSGYDHIIHVVNTAPLCNWGGLATVPGWWSLTRHDWPSTTKAILYHELGHNMGFHHAGSCANLRNSKLSVTDASFEGSNCQWEEYGDYMDLMGVPPRDELTEYKGWRFESHRRNHYYGSLPSTNAIKATTSGVYTLSNADDFSSPLGNKIVSMCYDLKTPRYVNFFRFDKYCLEMTNTENMNLQHPYTSGVVVRLIENDLARSTMLNVLGAAGDYFEDAGRGFKVTLVSVSGASADVRIDLA